MKKDRCLHRQTRLLLLLIACFLFAVPFSYAQNATLSVAGRVADSKNVPISGATVAVEGSKAATATDANGAFKINAAKGAVLHITAIGYQEFKVKVESDKSLSVTMKEDDAKMMNDVVVVGYGTQKRSDVTGAVVSVPKARLSQLPVTNVYQAIQGVVAGMNVTSGSSVPGATPSVNIRGQNSIKASTDPFVVVDGIPLTKSGGSINDINPNDIASVEILKDASAVAIYGVNGSSGVILITTKRGTTGKAQIRYNGYYGTENIAHILKPRDGASYVQKWKDYNAQSNTTPQYGDVPNIAELPYYNQGKTTDWMDVVTRQGIIQDHNLSISGGNKDVKYYVSGDYLNEKGPLIGYNYKRVSIRSNLDVNITDFLTVGTSLYFANNNYDGGRINLLNATAMSPYGQVTDANGNYIIYPMYAELLYTNPMLPQYTDQVNRSTNVNGNGYAEIKFPGALTGLKFRLNAAYTYLPTLAGSYVGRMANDLNGTASKTTTQSKSYIVENILTYTKDFGKSHVDFTGLYSAQQKLFDSTRAGAVGFINDQLSFNNLGAGATQTAASFASQYRINSQMARINYSYDSRYMITGTVRRDGSSVIGSSADKYGVFPSVGFGWNISNEKFMKGLQAINSLKLRGSYGKTGNEAISPYGTITKDKLARYPFNGLVSTGVVADNMGNNNLHWESTKGLNLGIDFAVLNSRISGSIDAYHTQTDGIILSRNIPVATGFTSVLDNIGKIDNKGIELNLNTKNIVTNDFRWESIIVFSRNKNKLVDIYGDGKNDVGNKWFIGQPVGVIYDYQMTGIWQQGEDPSKQDPSAQPGFIKFADVNHDGKITADSDRVVQGQTAPKWLGGFTNTFHYKDFHLSIFFQTVQGVTKNDNDLNYVDESGRRNTPQDVGYWTPTNKSQEFPALTTAANTGRRGYAYPRNASYTRLKDITLSYTVPQRLIDKMKLGSVTAYVSGRNLYTWTKWIGWDPENDVAMRGTGTDGTLGSWTNNYPTIRSFVFGLNVSLK